LVAGQWWREPALELSELARRVGTNTNYLSRALNEGLGMSFSEFINRLWVEGAQERLLGTGEVLEIAFDVGFRSKASFNRAFKACAGESPTAWRQSRRGATPPQTGAPRLES
jgi:AraC-like DNA-binding protein